MLKTRKTSGNPSSDTLLKFADALRRVASKKPFEKITVREIAAFKEA